MMVPRKFKIRRGATSKGKEFRSAPGKSGLFRSHTGYLSQLAPITRNGVPRPGAITKNNTFSGKENTPHLTGYKWENMKTDNLQIYLDIFRVMVK
ncbi:hypothetical protein NRE95_005337 [Salmonella enterica]|nr:hypothetical protein [Salmonella enterica]